MGLFGGWRKKKASSSSEEEAENTKPSPAQQQQTPSETSVFEFGSASSVGEERLTIAGYCPVSNDLEPCRWEVLPAPPATDGAAPLFRIVF